HSVPAPRAHKRSAQLRSLLSQESFHLSRLRSATMQEAIAELTARERFDVIQVESSQMFGFEFPKGPALVLDEHNIEHDLLQRVAAVEHSPPRRVYQRIEQRKVLREEIDAWQRADGCVVTSREDERRLHDAVPVARTRVVANGVDLDHFAPSRGAVDPL